MKTLAQIIVDQKCRKGKADGTTKKGAYWIAAEIKTRAWGGDGIGQSRADMDYSLQLRHFRNGDTSTVLHYHAWHQNTGTEHKYTPCPTLLNCITVEQIIVELKAFKACSTEYGCSENVYSDRMEEKLTEALAALGMPEMEAAPDETTP